MIFLTRVDRVRIFCPVFANGGVGQLDVLVVDDQADVASSTADVFRAVGLSAATAATVEDALHMINTRVVKSVIVDHQIADNEDTFLATGRDLPPVIVVSGMDRASLAEVQAVHGHRLFACLAKPVPPLTLIEVVRAAIESQ